MSNLKDAALAYHEFPIPGKIATRLTKPTETQRDLALAYSPGVAEPVKVIAQSPEAAYRFTQKGNLVGVISNGTAVLGLGNVGALASKPVMEGKGLLFKKLADIDVFDIEIDEKSPEKLIEIIASLEPTFGGINLEDIRGPECFIIEEELKKRMSIPVFHDDQHGTAITMTAALKNALQIQGKNFSDIKIVCIGAGAAGIACMRLLLTYGVAKEQIHLLDTKGLIVSSRKDLNSFKEEFAQHLPQMDLAQAMKGADVFIGLSVGNLLTEEMVLSMNEKPIIFAMANPDPEIIPTVALNIRQDLIVATGRSDYPNQVNNVLCFPYIFRGALDVRAKEINYEMMKAAVNAISELAHEPVLKSILNSYQLDYLSFGPQYILPKPMDPRLKMRVSAAVARAAIKSGVAQLPLPATYEVNLESAFA
jgi:malate dehydrogenase (oxaloacetate-decarboxylating)(NADP+)